MKHGHSLGGHVSGPTLVGHSPIFYLEFNFVFYHSMEQFILCMLFVALIMEQFSDHVLSIWVINAIEFPFY